MSELHYKVRCDKHAFKPHDYCEMCMIRTQLQEAIEVNRDMVQKACASMNLSVSVIHDCLEKHRKQIESIFEFLNKVNDSLKNYQDIKDWIDKVPSKIE